MPEGAGSEPHRTSGAADGRSVLLVTGGGRGIGAATAHLDASWRWAASAEGVLGAIEAAGGRAFVHQADVAVEADVVRPFEEVDRRLGRLTSPASSPPT